MIAMATMGPSLMKQISKLLYRSNLSHCSWVHTLNRPALGVPQVNRTATNDLRRVCERHLKSRTLLQVSGPGIERQSCGYASWKNKQKRLDKEQARNDNVFQYAGVHSKKKDRVYVWGCASTGALGVKAFLRPDKGERIKKTQRTPHRTFFWDDIDLKVSQAACGYGFTVLVCESEHSHLLYGAGINTSSQLGYQEFPKNSGRILDYVIEPVPIELPLVHRESTKLSDVACGRAHTVIVTDKEGVFSLGNNAYGQCGRPIVEGETFSGSQVINRIEVEGTPKQVVCGQDHTLFLMEDGSVYSCGLGTDGQTGLGHFKCESVLSKVGGDIEGEKIVQISSVADTVLALSDKGDVFGWGNCEYYQLGEVTDENQVNRPHHLPFTDLGGKVTQVKAAGSMCALLNDKGEVYVWGYGILGKGPRLDASSVPTNIPQTLFGQNEFTPQVKVTQLTAGMNHFAAMTDNLELFTWGKNKTGYLGLGHVQDQFFPIKVAMPAEPRQISCGVDHMVAICKSFA